MAFARTAARLVKAVQKAFTRKWTFLGAFVLVFAVSFTVLSKADLLPDASKANASQPIATTTVAHAAVTAPELPVKIVIPTINLSATIANPATTDSEVLDTALLKGAVRYPTSAKLGEQGNVILFGHSSYLPVVYNQAYKTFDGIQKLHTGDTITVYSSGTSYDYAVDTVTKEDANSAAIPLTVSGSVLTLSTCNSFATKSDRFVVTAHLVDSHPRTD
jgi:LPXTG-site transpeptidase (sortase) family protein